jgi:hypothetical protein
MFAVRSFHALWKLEKLASGWAGLLYGLELPIIGPLGQYHCKTFILNKFNSPLRWRIGLLGMRYNNFP